MKKYNKKDIENVMRMMNERAEYWEDRYDFLRKIAPDGFEAGNADGRCEVYQTCTHFLKLLLEQDYETLNQYDYYGKD